MVSAILVRHSLNFLLSLANASTAGYKPRWLLFRLLGSGGDFFRVGHELREARIPM